jgi:hypothetical protein
MRLKKPSTQKKQPRLNIPVEFHKFIVIDGETGVVGRNLLNGNIQTFFLTVPQTDERKKSTESRPDLKVWARENFVEFGVRKKIDHGAIFHFKGCMPWKDDSKGEHFKSHWVDRLGDNPAQVQECFVNGPAMMVDGQIENRTRMVHGVEKTFPFLVSGKVYNFETDPSKFICGRPDQALFDNVAAADAKNPSTSFLIRYMDNEGVAYDDFVSKSWASPLERRTSDVVAQMILNEISSTMTKLPSIQDVNILPVQTYSLSPKAIKANGPAFAKAHLCCTFVDAYGTEVKNVQHFFCKTGIHPNRNFINKLDCVDPFFGNRLDPAKNPTTIGGLSVSSAYDNNFAIMTGEEVPAQDHGNPQSQGGAPQGQSQHQGGSGYQSAPQDHGNPQPQGGGGYQGAPQDHGNPQSQGGGGYQGAPQGAPQSQVAPHGQEAFDQNDPFANAENLDREEVFDGPGMGL